MPYTENSVDLITAQGPPNITPKMAWSLAGSLRNRHQSEDNRRSSGTPISEIEGDSTPPQPSPDTHQ